METTPTQTLTLTLTRGSLTIQTACGVMVYSVESDGPFRGRGMIWVEVPGEDARVMEASGLSGILEKRG